MNLDPNWTQAFTAIVAIFISVFGLWFQNKQAKKREQNSEKRRTEDYNRHIKDVKDQFAEINRQRTEDYNRHIKEINEQQQREKDLKEQGYNAIKDNITNYVDYKLNKISTDDFIFYNDNKFEKWLNDNLSISKDSTERQILQIGKSSLI